jgi:hypothetical protein
MQLNPAMTPPSYTEINIIENPKERMSFHGYQYRLLTVGFNMRNSKEVEAFKSILSDQRRAQASVVVVITPNGKKWILVYNLNGRWITGKKSQSESFRFNIRRLNLGK